VAITGAGRGIGRAYAHAMAAEGANVLVNDLGADIEGHGEDRSPADEVVREILESGGAAVADHGDVSDFEAAGALVERAVEHFGGLDALINNAAIDHRGLFEEHSVADWDRVMAVNARGSFNCARHAVPVMRKRGRGAILNTTSGGFWEGTEGVVAYNASKAATFSLTLTQHTELRKYGITSNCIAPNATRTRMVENWIESLSRSTDRAEQEVLAEWGIQAPANLAPLAIVLCSDAGRQISGNIFEVWEGRISVVEPPQRGASIERDGDAWNPELLAEALPKLLG